MTPSYEVFALRYATTAPGRSRSENFLPGMDLHDGPMPLDYYVWAIRGQGRSIVVDTGFTQEAADARGRVMLHDPVDLLARIGIVAADVEDVILTHLHYDHAGSLSAFPSARFHLQDDEMAYATGRPMCHHYLRAPFNVADVLETVKLVYAGRVVFHRGEAELCPGVTVHRIGGHSGGLQVVRVATAQGPLVLASDAFHFNENRHRRAVFPLVANIGEMLDGFRVCEELADGREDLLIPGHDPEVLQRWPRADPGFADIVRLDLSPAN